MHLAKLVNNNVKFKPRDLRIGISVRIESRIESAATIRIRISNLELNQQIVVYSFNVKFLLIAI